jgi:maleamate amidohydrolase
METSMDAPLLPARTALVLMHFQDDITCFFPPDEMSALLGRCRLAIAACRDAGVRIVFVNIRFSPDYREISPRNRNGMWLKSTGSFRNGRTAPELEPAPGDLVLEAQRINVFHGTPLEAHLRAAAIDTLILGGLTTTGVVVSSLPYASDLDYRLLALSDCCYDPDKVAHEALFATAFSTRAEILQAADLAARLAV